MKPNRNDLENCQIIEERDRILKKRVKGKDIDRRMSTERDQNAGSFDLKREPCMGPNEIHKRKKKNPILQEGEDSSGCYHYLPIELLDGTATRVVCAPKLNPKIGKIARSRKRKGMEYLR